MFRTTLVVFAVVVTSVVCKRMSSLKLQEEMYGDEPPPPKHHGYHMMKKPYTDYVNKQMSNWHPKMKQNIWELSGLFEGDIMESEPEEIHEKGIERNAVIDDTLLWPEAAVPYYISSDFDETEKDIIRGAMEDYHDISCVRFRPYKKGDDDFVLVRGDSPGCWSFVGRRGGGQVVNLRGLCVQHGVAIHELLHALGFYHQQSATNRDDYIKIHWQNIWPGAKRNFQKYDSWKITDFDVGYDYDSIMHYSTHAFSRNGNETITPLEEEANIGQRIGLSDKDIKKINIMYSCNQGKSNKHFTPTVNTDNDYYSDVSGESSEESFPNDHSAPSEDYFQNDSGDYSEDFFSKGVKNSEGNDYPLFSDEYFKNFFSNNTDDSEDDYFPQVSDDSFKYFFPNDNSGTYDDFYKQKESKDKFRRPNFNSFWDSRFSF